MPHVSSEIFLKDCRVSDVWPIMSDFEGFPLFMKDVVKVAVEQGTDPLKSDWRVLLNGSELTWTEHDWFEHERSISFAQIDGDLEKWEGDWKIDQVGPDVRVSLEVTFDIGIPSLESVLNPMGIRAIHRNINDMLSAISNKMAGKV